MRFGFNSTWTPACSNKWNLKIKLDTQCFALLCSNITHSHINGVEHTMTTEKTTEHMLNTQESSKEHAKHAASKFHHPNISHVSDAYAFQIRAIYIWLHVRFLCIYFGLVLFSHSPKLFLCRGRSPKWQCDTPSVQVICMHFITDLKYKLDSIWFTAEMVSILIYLCWPRSSLKWYTIER